MPARRYRNEWLLLGVLLLALGSFIGYQLAEEHDAIEARETERLAGQAHVIDENLGRLLEGVNGSLVGVRNDLPQWDGESMRGAASRRLKTLSDAMPGVRAVAVLDASGTIAAASRDELVGLTTNLTEIFGGVRESMDADTLYVSPPLKTPLGVVTMFLARAVVSPGGAFAGLVAAALDPEYFTVLLRSVLYAPDMWTALAHGDGKLFLIVPPNDRLLGLDGARPGSFFSRHRESGRNANVLTGTGFVTGEERMIAIRTFRRTGLPMSKSLGIAVSRNLSSVFAPWRGTASYQGGSYGLFALATILGLAFVQRRRRLLDRLLAEQQRERHENAERLNLALRGAGLGLWDWHLSSGRFVCDERWCAMLGCRIDELASGRRDWEQRVHPDDAPRVRAALDAHLAGGAPGYASEYRMRHQDGHWVWILDHGKVVERDAAGAAVRMVGTQMDITERKRAEEAVRKSEARFRSLTQLSSDWYWEQDQNYRFTSLDGALRERTGISGTEHIGKTRWELPELNLTEADWAEHRARLDARLPFHHLEMRRPDAQGRMHWVSISGEPMFDDQGAFCGYRGVGSDITERKQVQSALRESEARYRTLIDTLPAGVLLHHGGTITLANQEAARLLGFERTGQAIGARLYDLVPDDVRDILWERNRQVQEDDRNAPALEFQIMRADGSRVEVETMGVSVRDAGEKATLTIWRDITKRKEARQALHKLSAAVEQSPVTVVITDADGRIEYVNPHFELVTGYAREEVLGKNPRILSSGTTSHEAYRELWDTITSGRVWRGEFRNRRKNGELFLERASIAPIHDARRRITHYVAVKEDITEFRRTQEVRESLEAQLRESQKMEALGTLAGGIAHDFNNIVAAIMGNVDLARQDVGPGHAALESLEEIRKASRRAKELVQQILAFGRRQVLERKVIALAPAVEESVRLLRATLPAGVRLRVECAADVPLVLADATQIGQVVLNLCGNAWQATQGQSRPGIIEVRLETCDTVPGEARHEARAGRYACLTVRDNGIGMDAATRARMFEPFFTTKPAGQGTGLGLSVVHGIVQAHDASIAVESAVGEGTEFRIYFPAAPVAVVAAATEAAAAVPMHGQGRCILYLDDDEAMVFLMKRMLERQGYRVSGHADAREALDAVRAAPGRFDLVVTDYNMPGMSGLEVASELRRIRADLPVALASGHITEELRAGAPAAGVSELIHKPDTVDALCETVARLANSQRTQKPIA